MSAKGNIYHFPNRKTGDLPGGIGALWQRVAWAQSDLVQMLHDPIYTTHTREDARQAKQRGYGVVFRAKGEGLQNYPSDVLACLTEVGVRKNDQGQVIEKAVADYIIVGGNEPQPGELWTWLFNLEQIAIQCGPVAAESEIVLVMPALHGLAEPFARPPAKTNWRDVTLPLELRLRARYYEVADMYKAFATHAYAEHVFDGHCDRLERWAEAMAVEVDGETQYKEQIVAEIGLAALNLVAPPAPPDYTRSGYIKAERTAQFQRDAMSSVPGLVGLSRYIDRCSTEEWGRFTFSGQYDPGGCRGYWLDDMQLEHFGECVMRKVQSAKCKV